MKRAMRSALRRLFKPPTVEPEIHHCCVCGTVPTEYVLAVRMPPSADRAREDSRWRYCIDCWEKQVDRSVVRAAESALAERLRAMP